MATDTTDNSFDASAGIISIGWKLKTSYDIDSRDNDVNQRTDNDMTCNRPFEKKTRTTALTRSHKPEEHCYKS